jgi:hypothetical protein
MRLGFFVKNFANFVAKSSLLAICVNKEKILISKLILTATVFNLKMRTQIITEAYKRSEKN